MYLFYCGLMFTLASMQCDTWWVCAAVFLALLPYTGFLVNCRDRKSGCMLARRWLFQAVGGVVIHSAASLILLWGGFPCQEAPAWPPAHQPHLAPAYRRPTAHALALRVGGESKLAGLGMDTFWQELLSPHSTEWSADCSAEHKRPEASISSSCGLQACVPLCWLQYFFFFWKLLLSFWQSLPWSHSSYMIYMTSVIILHSH